MALDTLKPPEQDSDPIQSNYDEQFAQMTSPKNYGRSGGQDRGTPSTASLRNQEASGTEKGLFNRSGDSASENNKTGPASGVGAAGMGAIEALGNGFNPVAAAGGGMRGLAKAFIGSRRRKQATIGGSIAGLVIGGGFFFLSIATGPLEIIHFAQLMQHIHLTTNDNQSNDRTGKIFRSVKNLKSGTVYRNNLGFLGNRYANRIEAKLKAAGYESSYNPRTGQWEGLVPDRNGPEYKNMNDNQYKAAVEEKLGVTLKQNIPNEKGVTPLTNYSKETFFIDPRETGYSKGVRNSRGVISDILTKSGYSSLTSSIDARVMGKRFGLTLHPIKRLDSKLIAAADEAIRAAKAKKATQAEQDKAAADAEKAAWEDEQAQLINEGDTLAFEDIKNATNDPKASDAQNAATDSKAASTKSAADTTAQEAQSAGRESGSGQAGALSKLTHSVSFKITGGLAALVGVACLAKGLDDTAVQIKEIQVIEPLMRMSGELLSLAAQIQTGQDLDMKQVAYYANTLNNPTTHSNFIQAQSIQAESGNAFDKSQVSTTLTTINDNASPFHFLNEGVIGTALNGACSTAGQVGLLVISFLGGPVSTVVGGVLAFEFGPAVINQAVQWFAGKAVNTGIVGAERGDAINYGTKLLANAGAISTGGGLLSANQVGALKVDESVGYQKQIASESFVKRTLDPSNSTSLVASLVDKFAVLRTNGLTNTISSLFSLKNYTGMIGAIFTKHASAAALSESYDYGIPTYGFTKDDMDNQDTSDPFANADAASAILDGTDGQKYIDRAQQCFGVNITPDRTAPDGHTEWVVSADLTSKTNYYGSDYKSMAGDCADQSNAWLKIRFMIFDTQNMKSIACNEGDTQSCIELGFGSGSAGAPPQ
jgi:hypothetical protein